MKYSSATILAVATCGALLNANAFTPTRPLVRAPTTTFVARSSLQQQASTTLFVSSSELTETTTEKEEMLTEAEKLKARAAKLRAEAASAEAEQAQKFADYTQKVFDSFDTNKDGDISLDELKAGLEKTFKLTEPIPEGRVQKIMDALDTNKDGALQMEEFGSVNKVMNKLEAITWEEKDAKRELAKAAAAEKEAGELKEARLTILNEGAPTNTDKLVSVLPYLFPLVDSLQYAGPFVVSHPDNPVAQAIAVVYTLYRSVPFAAFVTLFGLSILSSNPSFNRQVRFNMNQAISLDIALIIPGILATAGAFVANGLGIDLSGLAGAGEITGDALVVAMLATVGYASVSSLLGQTPNKIPLISDRVEKEMLSLDMFDENGRFIGRPLDDAQNDDDKKKQD